MKYLDNDSDPNSSEPINTGINTSTIIIAAEESTNAALMRNEVFDNVDNDSDPNSSEPTNTGINTSTIIIASEESTNAALMAAKNAEERSRLDPTRTKTKDGVLVGRPYKTSAFHWGGDGMYRGDVDFGGTPHGFGVFHDKGGCVYKGQW